jgi:outer membrane protein assembly factor BamB
VYWTEDLKSSVRASPLSADGKVYVCSEDGDVHVFAHGREKKRLARIETDGMISASPVFANGTLYVTTDRGLYAVRAAKGAAK